MAERQRSPNYPAIDIAEAIELTRRIYREEKRTAVPAEFAAKAMGYASLSGPARTKIAALKKYLLLDDAAGALRVSDLALKILMTEEDTPDWWSAVREAALAPEIFRSLLATHADASLQALKAHLVLTRDFTEDGAKQLSTSFKKTAEFARLYESASEPAQPSLTDEPEMPVDRTPQTRLGPSDRDHHRAAATFSWPLSRDVTVEVRFIGSQIKPSHFETLRQYLELVKATWADEEAS